MFLKIIFLFTISNVLVFSYAKNVKDSWLTALPFKRTLKLQKSLIKGKDVVILQNLLRRYRHITSLGATGFYGIATRDALRKFQQNERLKQQDGVLDVDTAKKVVQLLMHDGYKDNEKCRVGYKFKLHVPVYRNRNVETNATLYKCNDGDAVPKYLYSFKIRTRGSTKRGHPLNQLTSNGDTPTGMSRIDLNTRFPRGKLTRMFGPYPILRLTKGLQGNVAIGKDGALIADGDKKDTFLNNYRFGILVHTGVWKNWNKSLPMPNSNGCLKVHPHDQKKIVKLLKRIGVDTRKNTYGKLPYPYDSQGYISVEEID